MKRLIPLIIGWILFPVAASLAGEYPSIVAVAVEGDVSLSRNGETQKVRIGTKFEAGDSVMTLADSHLDFVWYEKVGYRLLQSSRITIVEMEEKFLDFKVEEGDLILNVGKLSREFKLQVSTPTSVATVRGTQFWVRFLNQIASIIVKEGLVEAMLLASRQTHQLGPGKAIDVPVGAGDALPRDATPEEKEMAEQSEDVPLDQTKTNFGDDNPFNGSGPGGPGSGGLDTAGLQGFDAPSSSSSESSDEHY